MRAAVRGAIALAALAIVWGVAAAVLRHTRPMGLPLDDSYVYLAYAKQLGRGQPFSYAPGGGFSSAASGVLWPVILAPFWALGARGHALVWVAFAWSAALYVATALGVHRIVARIAGGIAGALAAVLVLAIAPFAWHALAGGGTALASVLLVTLIRCLLDAPSDATAPSPRWLAACLAATALACPEAVGLVIAVSGVAAARRIRRRDLAGAAWCLVPLAALAAWLVAGRLATGAWLSGTGPHGHLAPPGFDAAYWREAVVTLTGHLLRGVFWDPASPLVWPRLFAVLWLAGAIRVVMWARRERRVFAGALIVAAPLVVMLSVIAWSSAPEVQNYRTIAPAFPLLAITAGCAFAPLGPFWPRASRSPRGHRRWPGHGLSAAAGLVAAAFAVAAIPRLVADARLFAQGVMDRNAQVVAVGEYIHRKLPGARVMVQDPGAIAYYGDARITELAGGSANHGAGALFELLEDLPPDQRPTHFAVYADRADPADSLGITELFGEVVLHTAFQTGRGLVLDPRRMIGGPDLQLIAASWDHVGTGERPLNDHTGWAIADRIDVADLASEAAHRWAGGLGRPRFGDPAARWSVVGREVGAHGLVFDGGRTIRGGTERFTITIDPAKPVRLVLRTGGARAYRFHEPIDHPVPLRVLDPAGREIAHATLPAATATGGFAEVTFALPAGASPVLRTEASSPYRAFHWFVLQPE